MFPHHSGRPHCRVHLTAVVVVLFLCCVTFPVLGADGFLAWDKTLIWSGDCQIRSLEWVDGHGWFAGGAELQPDGDGGYWPGDGVLVQSTTGASGWGGNLLNVPSPWDGEYGPGGPIAGMAHHGNTLVVTGPDSIYARDLTAGTWGLSYGWGENWDTGEPELMAGFAWGGGVAWGADQFVMTDTLSMDGPNKIVWWSANGVEWTMAEFAYSALPENASGEWDHPPGFPICYGDGRYVAVSSFGWIITSTDGLTWQTARAGSTSRRTLRGVAEKGGVFVAVGDSGTVLRSTNGTSWQRCAVPVTKNLYSVTAGTNWFMAVGADDTVLISTDGYAWQEISVPSGGRTTTKYTAVGYGNQRFIIAGADGYSQLSGVEPLAVKIVVSPPGSGVAGVTDQGALALAAGDTLEVTATPQPGFRFAGWAGDVVQDDAHLTTIVNAPLSLRANFVAATPLRVAFREGPSLNDPRAGHRMLSLGNGAAVAVGGHTIGFTRSDTMDAGDAAVTLFTLRDMESTADGATVARLADGSYLVAGGAQDNYGIAPGIDTALLVSADGSTATLVPAQMVRGRMNAGSARLADGTVLIAGGWFDLPSATYGELFTAATTRGDASFVETGVLNSPRSHPLVIPTTDGGAVVAGGRGPNGGDITRLEYYNAATKTFSVLAETVLDDGELWVLNTDLPGDIRRQERSDGTFVFWGWHKETLAGAAFIFDPVTKSFSSMLPSPSLKDMSRQAFMPVLGTTDAEIFLLMAACDEAQTETRFVVHSMNLLTGKCMSMVAPVTVAGYFPGGATLTGFVQDGSTRLLLAGGVSQLGLQQNWYPVSRTFIFDPTLSMPQLEGATTTVSTDPRGFQEQTNNVCMTRDAAGAIYLTYTRAVRSGVGWYGYVRMRDADGNWRREVRTERFPDSSTANSLVLDDAGRLHQGLTFNVGAFHTYANVGTGSSRADMVLPWDEGPKDLLWSTPTPIWDGGWGAFDYDAKLALYEGRLFSVSSRAYGWYDFPLNLMLREWHADTGWGTPYLLTSLPNEDSAGTGVQGHHFQIRPDGYGVVLYAARPQTDPQEVKLLEVGLPHNSTVTVPVSASGRWARAGDVAVDSAGVSHLVWMEADASDGTYELWYATHHTVTGLSAPIRVSAVGEASVRSATVGAYGGGRVLVAYAIAGGSVPYGGVFLRQISDTVSAPIQLGGTTNAHCPGLRSTWDMLHPNIVDLTWVEKYSWGSRLLHQELSWAGLGGGAGATVTIQSNELTASFTLSGPHSGNFSLVGGEWVSPSLPLGLYTITWDPIAGMDTPPAQTFELTGSGVTVIAASYIDENLHRVVTDTSPVGAGAITQSPAGMALLGGDTAQETGTVYFRALPVEGQGFVRWRVDNGLGIGYHTTNPLGLVIDRDTSITAEFGLAGPFHVDTTLYGAGTITPGTVLPSGSRFVCTISPAAGTNLEEVLLDGVPQGLVTEVVIESVSGPHHIQAFTDTGRNRITATWLPEDGGVVTQSPETYSLGDTVTVTAQPAAGYRFHEWRGDAGGTDRVVHILVDAAKAVEAIFVPEGVILGDLNDDGAISIEDAVIARSMYAGTTVPVDLVHGDMDQNGRLDTADITEILQAEARGDRPCLGGQQVEPDPAKRLIGFSNGIGLTLPGGWIDTSLRASVALGVEDELPPLPPSLERVTPIYDIRLAGVGSFGRDIGFQIPVAEAARRSGEPLRVLFLDTESGDWVTLPTKVDTSRAGTTTYSSARRSGTYLVAKVSGTKNAVQGTHCVVYYDPSITHTLGGATVGAADFGVVVADQFDAAYQGYAAAGYALPSYHKSSVDLFLTSVDLDRRADIYLSDASNTYSEPFYSWKTKNYYIPAKFDNANDALFNLAHELFHAVQNQKFSGPSMAANRWLFEMTAEYASRKEPHTHPLSTEYGLYPGTPLGTLDEIHEYSCAHLMKYLLDQTGGTFKTLWDTKLAASYTPYRALNTYAKSAAGMSLGRVHAQYLTAMMFDSAYADIVAAETGAQVNGVAWGTGNVIDTTFTIPKGSSAGWMKSKYSSLGSYPANVLVEILDDIPAHANVRVFNAPVRDPKTAGGRTYLCSLYSGESLPFVSTSLATDQDGAYVTGYNYFGSSAETVHVRIRPITVNVVQNPEPLTSGVECTFTGTVAPIPDCAQQLKVYWKLSDGTPWQIETVPATTPEFELKHAFVAEKDKIFQVTLEVYCLDSDGRRRELVKHTQDVTVSGRPGLVISPNVQQVEVNQVVTFTAQVQNGPDSPQYQWTFGDGSPDVATNQPTTTHAYTAVQEDGYAVTVKLADAGNPTVPIAEANGRVVVLDPVQVVDDPPTGNDPAAPTLDYSRLRRIDEVRFWDEVREVYFVDGAGRKHGLYQSFIQSGSSQRPLEAGMYIQGRQEGQWQIHMQDGSGAIENRHFHHGLWVGTGAAARAVTMMARFGSRTDRSGTNVYLYGSGLAATDWPSVVAGSSCVLHYGDGTYETVAFDGAGRRSGPCTLQYDVNVRGRGLEIRTIHSGTFSAGVKTGHWKYLEWSGNTATGVTYDHSKDPPNQ